MILQQDSSMPRLHLHAHHSHLQQLQEVVVLHPLRVCGPLFLLLVHSSVTRYPRRRSHRIC